MSAQLGEQGRDTGPKAKADQKVYVLRVSRVHAKEERQRKDAQQVQHHDGEPHDAPATEGDQHRSRSRGAGRGGGAHVGPRRRVHSHQDGQHRKGRADDKAQRDLPVSLRHDHEQQQGQNRHEWGNGEELAAEERIGPNLDKVGDLSHPLGAGVLLAQPQIEKHDHGQGKDGGQGNKDGNELTQIHYISLGLQKQRRLRREREKSSLTCASSCCLLCSFCGTIGDATEVAYSNRE
jgi:hypothetical protein